MHNRIMKLGLALLGFLAALALLAVLAFPIVNRSNGAIVSSGENRRYLLYVPERYDPTVPTPLVIGIHGFAQWPAHQAQISRWNKLADEHGFLVVYPMGTSFPLRWRTYGLPGSETDPAVEVQFYTDLIDHLAQEYNIDPRRIYANGLSNGGGMSFVLSCRLSERIAAVGLVAGAYLYPWEECHPSRPVPAMVFHGTADPIVPFQGGPSQAFDIPFPVIPAWVGALAWHNGCAEPPAQLPPRGEVSGTAYQGCAADVVFYTINGGGHTWPGGGKIPAWIAGRTSPDIDATREMWQFFQQHPLPE